MRDTGSEIRETVLELDLGGFLLRRVGDLEERRRLEVEHPRQDVRRERLELRVVLHGGVVVELPREADLVFRRGELLLEREEVRVRLELGVLLDDDHEPAERAAKARLDRKSVV